MCEKLFECLDIVTTIIIILITHVPRYSDSRYLFEHNKIIDIINTNILVKTLYYFYSPYFSYSLSV